LGVLAATAENPTRIKKLFDLSRQQPGRYAVDVTKNGEAIEVIVDDQFPCLNQRPIFSSAHGKELWVLVLEKVWGKIHRTYKRIEAG
jgi:calpain-15|tara:strand:+ start:285 stop:545 length:261 start_codon:yes stop_codon:yes gene_type:complete